MGAAVSHSSTNSSILEQAVKFTPDSQIVCPFSPLDPRGSADSNAYEAIRDEEVTPRLTKRQNDRALAANDGEI